MNKLITENLEKAGFSTNQKIINGFRPHFFKGNDLVFLINKSFFCSKIVKIDSVFENYEGRIYGIALPNCPVFAAFDWVTAKKLILLNYDLMYGQWHSNKSAIEYVPFCLD